MSDLVISVAAIKKLKVTELKAELAKRGLSTKGKKDELMSRLISEVEGEGATEENEDLPQPEDVSVTECTEASEIESQDVTFSDPTSSVSTLCMEDGVSSATEAMEVAADARAADKHTSISQSLAHVDSVEPTSEDDWVILEKPSEGEMDVENAVNAVVPVATHNDSAPVSHTSHEAVTGEANVEVLSAHGVGQDSAERQASTIEPVKEMQVEDLAAHLDQAKPIEEENKYAEFENLDEYFEEVEYEEGEECSDLEVADGQIVFDRCNSDLNFVIGKDGCVGHNLVKNGFAYMWAGAQANKGVKGGKVCFEVKIIASLDVDLPESEEPRHAVRVGWSSETSGLQLGEASLSYGYESTGKVCASSKFFDYGESFGEGDVIGTYLDLESDPKTLKYTKNGVDLGVAMSLSVKLGEKILFPSFFVRNMKIHVNFGALKEPFCKPLDGYSWIQNAEEHHLSPQTSLSLNEKCQVLMMIGLPHSGKTSWVERHVEKHREMKFNVISLKRILERCKIEGKERRKSEDGHAALMANVVKIMSKLYQMCPKIKRNYIYDQLNVYRNAQKRKMELFTDFHRVAVVIVPTHDNLRRRTSEARRRLGDGDAVPFGDLCNMKCGFYVPDVGELFHEVLYPELEERNAKKTVAGYKSDGLEGRKSGRDDYYYPKKHRYDESSSRYERSDRSSEGGRESYRRDWRSSGSGYGGQQDYRSGGTKYRGGGYRGASGSSYNDQYRKSGSGGSGGGGYRQHSSYRGGGSYNKGGWTSGGYGSSSYGAGGYGSSNSYGSSGGYGSGYGSSNYGQSGYSGSGSYGGSSGYGSYGSSYNANTSNFGTGRGRAGGQWSQGYSHQGYNQPHQQSNQQQGSWSSGTWGGGYNYGNYGNSGSGYGGGYNY